MGAEGNDVARTRLAQGFVLAARASGLGPDERARLVRRLSAPLAATVMRLEARLESLSAQHRREALAAFAAPGVPDERVVSRWPPRARALLEGREDEAAPFRPGFRPPPGLVSALRRAAASPAEDEQVTPWPD